MPDDGEVARDEQDAKPEASLHALPEPDDQSVQRRMRVPDGICEEAVTLLKDKTCPMAIFEILGRLKPLRLIGAAEFLINADTCALASDPGA